MSTPKPLHNEIKVHLQDLLDEGWTTPSQSLYSTPMECGCKKDGSRCLFCDFGEVNCKSVPDRHPIPRIWDMLDELGESSLFSVLVIKHATRATSMKRATPWQPSSCPGDSMNRYTHDNTLLFFSLHCQALLSRPSLFFLHTYQGRLSLDIPRLHMQCGIRWWSSSTGLLLPVRSPLLPCKHPELCHVLLLGTPHWIMCHCS